MNAMKPIVSVIVPIHNGEKWIDRCFNSILSQNALGVINFEVCVCNDASTDDTVDILDKWKQIFKRKGVCLCIYENPTDRPKGVGFSKNKAVSLSNGDYLCFQDVDDVMLPNRITAQCNFAIKKSSNILIGSQFVREPENSTLRYTKWANLLTQEQLNKQIYTSHGPTIIMPTWFCHRSIFTKIGGFSELGVGTPEDLLFFYAHLDTGGVVSRVDEPLIVYSYHSDATTFSILKETIWRIRLEQLQKNVLLNWPQFTIWNAGKQGRHFYNSLSKENQEKVIAMCDVSINLIGTKYTPYYVDSHTTGSSVPIIHFTDAQPPFILCVKTDLSHGEFEKNLDSLNIKENHDYIYFS